MNQDDTKFTFLDKIVTKIYNEGKKNGKKKGTCIGPC